MAWHMHIFGDWAYTGVWGKVIELQSIELLIYTPCFRVLQFSIKVSPLVPGINLLSSCVNIVIYAPFIGNSTNIIQALNWTFFLNKNDSLLIHHGNEKEIDKETKRKPKVFYILHFKMTNTHRLCIFGKKRKKPLQNDRIKRQSSFIHSSGVVVYWNSRKERKRKSGTARYL